MPSQLRNLIIGVGLFFLIVIIFFVIMLEIIPSPYFNYDVYLNYQAQYVAADENFDSHAQEVKEYIEYVQNHENPETINKSLAEILPEPAIDTGFVTMNDEQLREVALIVLDEGYKYFGHEDVKMINSVFAIDELTSVYLGIPQSYLYYCMTSDEQNIVAFSVVIEGEDQYTITPLWSVDVSNDFEITSREANRALFIYTIERF